jgi:hypothetical protein
MTHLQLEEEMSELFDDIATAFNQSRLQLANDFDKMREDNMKFYRTHAQAWVDSVYKEYGDDGVGAIPTYTVALLASTGDVLLDFVQGVGASTFIDPLRLGEGVKKGTAGGYVEDSLRVIGVVGGAVKLLKFGKFALAAGELRGGVMSCTSSSAAKALIQAEIKSLPTVEEVAKGTSGGTSVLAPSYSGAFIKEIVPNLTKASVGATVEQSQVSSVKEVVNLVNQNKGPVLFSVSWQAAGSAPGGAHSMMAYRPFFGSGIRLADQFGNLHTLESVNTAAGPAFRVIAGPGTTAARLSGFAGVVKRGDVIGQIASVYKDAYVLRDAVLLDVAANLPLAQRVGVPIYTALDDQFNLKLGYAASQLPTAPPKLMATGNSVKKAIALNPSGTSAQTRSAGTRPSSAAIPLSANAQKLLSLLGGSGSAIDGKSLHQKAMAAGIGQMQYHPALDELEEWGAVTVERAAVDRLTIISVTRN